MFSRFAVTHTTIQEIEHGRHVSLWAVAATEKALLKIALAKLEHNVEVIKELVEEEARA